jgi:hypothetical protein
VPGVRGFPHCRRHTTRWRASSRWCAPRRICIDIIGVLLQRGSGDSCWPLVPVDLSVHGRSEGPGGPPWPSPRPRICVSLLGEGKTCASRHDVRCRLLSQEVVEHTRDDKGLTCLQQMVTEQAPPAGAGRALPGQPSSATPGVGATNVTPPSSRYWASSQKWSNKADASPYCSFALEKPQGQDKIKEKQCDDMDGNDSSQHWSWPSQAVVIAGRYTQVVV